MQEKNPSLLYRLIKGAVRLCYPKIEVVGAEHLPQEPVMIVGNHCQLHGPIACELYAPGKCYTWCAGEMMRLREVPAYAYEDFWSHKPRWSRWFYRLLSYLIAPLSVCVFNNADTIAVYHDTRLIRTFRDTVARLQEGASVIVFPEHDGPAHDQTYNHILSPFQDKFVDIARSYYRKTGRELAFVPLYIAPRLRKLYLGTPIRFRADAPIEEERQRICQYLMEQITLTACALPPHTVVPYRNIPKKYYPSNVPCEVPVHEKTCG